MFRCVGQLVFIAFGLFAAGSGQSESRYEGAFGAGYIAEDGGWANGPLLYADVLAHPAKNINLRFSITQLRQEFGNVSTTGRLEVTFALPEGVEIGGFATRSQNSSVSIGPQLRTGMGAVLRFKSGKTRGFFSAGETKSHRFSTWDGLDWEMWPATWSSQIAIGVSRDVSDRFSWAVRADAEMTEYVPFRVRGGTFVTASAAAVFEPRRGLAFNSAVSFGKSYTQEVIVGSIGASVMLGSKTNTPVFLVVDYARAEDLIGQGSSSYGFIGIEVALGQKSRKLPARSYAAGIFDQY
jgi:hypothetical protein